jgi:NitT/TauT family transport system ATP-binding protein
MGKILDVESLSVSFQPVPGRVLEDISFSLDQGSRTAVIGPSGCGKTTLLRALAGSLDAAIFGNVRWAEEVHPPVPIVWQDIRLFPWMTVRQNVEYVLRLRGSKQPRELSSVEFLQAVGMDWATDLWPNRLSRGQAQCVALARALATRSAVLLFDEPFASLDAITRKKMGRLLLDLASSRGFSYLFVTHDAREAIELTDRILVLTARPARLAAEFVRVGSSFEEGIENRIWELLAPPKTGLPP